MHVFNLTKIEDLQPVNTEIPQQNTCPNCNSVISCGCQRVQATDGNIVCNDCILSYEDRLKSAS